MKINEIEGFPKELLKGKTVSLYKAYLFENSEDEMNINTSIDLLAISKEAALEQMMNDIPLESTWNDLLTKLWDRETISFAVIKLDKADLLKKDIVDEGDVFFENGVLSITLKDKQYKIDVEDNYCDNITIEDDEKTLRKKVTKVKLAKA